MRKILVKKFFNRPTLVVARELIGKYLIRRRISLIRANRRIRRRSKEIALMITETEAYDGFKDKASHAHRGRTERNKIMFGQAGHIYVYFTYGMHWMLNIVTGERDYPAAVLIRSASTIKTPTWTPGVQVGVGSGILGHEVNGPARLTKFLKIDKKLNGKELGRKSGLWIEDRRNLKIKNQKSKLRIIRTPRIGVRYAGAWSKKPYRFALKTLQ